MVLIVSQASSKRNVANGHRKYEKIFIRDLLFDAKNNGGSWVQILAVFLGSWNRSSRVFRAQKVNQDDKKKTEESAFDQFDLKRSLEAIPKRVIFKDLSLFKPP